nr:MAG TPA: hypothetical protein [Caudoviricetes sp.]
MERERSMHSEVQDHFAGLLKWLLSPEVLSQIGLYIGVGASIVGFASRAFKKLWAKLEAKQNEEIEGIKNSITALAISFEEMRKTQELDFLRLQIITGIHSGRLSNNEILTMYDAYSDKGGNSYVSRIVNDYVDENNIKEEGKRNARKRN